MKGKTKLRRLLSLLLCMVMVLGLLPTTAFSKNDAKITFIVIKMTEPQVGMEVLDVRASVTSQTTGARVAMKSIEKKDSGEGGACVGNFISGCTYRLYMMIKPTEGYTFRGTTDTTVQINFTNTPVTVDRSALDAGEDYIEARVEWTMPGTAADHKVTGTDCRVNQVPSLVFSPFRSLFAPAGTTIFVNADALEPGKVFDHFEIEPADVELSLYQTKSVYQNPVSNQPATKETDPTYVKFIMPDENVSITAKYRDANDTEIYDMSVTTGTPKPGQTNTDFQERFTTGSSNYEIAEYFTWIDSYDDVLYATNSKEKPFTFTDGETYKCRFWIKPKENCTLTVPYTLKVNGQASGFTAKYDKSWIWCELYLTASNDLTGSATLSSAYYDSYVNPTLDGQVEELRKTDYSKLRFQWQRSTNGTNGWTNISGANNLSYRTTDADFGKFLRIVITAEGFTGQVASNGVEVQKALVNFTKPASPRLEYSDTYGLEVTNAVKGQEYKVTSSPSAPADWTGAALATEDGVLALSASKNTTVYVHTRVADSDYKPAGIYTECSRIYTGAPTTLVDFSLGYTTLDLKVGEVVELTASPIPESAADWTGVQWYVNDSSAKLYRDKACTQVYDRYTHGYAVTVYLKGITQDNVVTVGAERTFAGSGGIPTTRQMVARVADANGNYLLEWLTFPNVTLAPGERTTVDIGTYPSPAIVGALSFVGDSTNPSNEITLSPSADKKTLTITASENAMMGSYRYTVNVNGAGTSSPSSISIGILDSPREIPSESLWVCPGSLNLAPGGSAALTAILTPTNTTDTVTWSRKSGSSTITVDADGVVTVSDDAPDGASAVIQAAAGGGTVSITVKVTTAKYTLNVTGGDAFDKDYNLISGPIEAGTLVQLSPAFSAGDAEFIQWVVTSGAATILDPTAPFVSFYMPAEDVEVKATFTKVNPFTDVSEGDYYYDAVLWAVEKDITAGTTPTTFSPKNICTRAQAVTFLWRAAGSPDPESSEMPFKDVPKDIYYRDAVLWAVEKGITDGTSPTTFNPNGNCTRGQIVTFLYRWQGEPHVSSSCPFTDVQKGAYYYDAVLWAVKEGITKGTSSTTFSPNNNCTREQIVTFLYRYLVK